MTATYTPEHLKLWNCGGEFASGFDSCSNYAGDSFSDYYVVVSKNRDSEILSNINFDVALERLGGEQFHEDSADDKGELHIVRVVRIGHWACGWIEHLMVHKDAPAATLQAADSIREDLKAYPILDEDRYSEAQDEAYHDYWKGMTLMDRVDACRSHGDSIFAARHTSSIPEGVYNDLRDSDMFN